MADTHRNSDQYIMRFPTGMRERLKLEAKENNRSLNSEIVARLAASLGEGVVSTIDNASDRLVESIAKLEKLLSIASPAGEKIRSTQDEVREAVPLTGQSPVGAVSTPTIAERVREIVVSFLVGPNERDVKEGASLINDLGADSLDVVEIILAVEQEFGIDVPNADAEMLLTVGDLTKYVERKVS